MRIALICAGIPPLVVGGMERHSLNLARSLGRLGVNVDLYYTNMGQPKIHNGGFDGLMGAPFTPIFVPWPARDRLPGHYIRELKAYSEAVLTRYAQEPAPDFIYTQSITGIAFLNARQRGMRLPPIGVNGHGYEMFQPTTHFRTFLEQQLMRPSFGWCSKMADVLFSFGGDFPKLLTESVGVSPDRITVIPNAIESHWIRTEPTALHQPFRFIFVGRNEKRKGIEDLNQVLQQGSVLRGCEFHFVSGIDKTHQITQPHVHYHGKITDDDALRELLDASDCLICPSYAEGMPTVILEAMARGLAVIGTDVGAVREMVGSDNGILMPKPGVTFIQKAMSAMLAMPAERIQSLKKDSLRKVRQYTWDRVAQMTKDRISVAL